MPEVAPTLSSDQFCEAYDISKSNLNKIIQTFASRPDPRKIWKGDEEIYKDIITDQAKFEDVELAIGRYKLYRDELKETHTNIQIIVKCVDDQIFLSIPKTREIFLNLLNLDAAHLNSIIQVLANSKESPSYWNGSENSYKDVQNHLGKLRDVELVSKEYNALKAREPRSNDYQIIRTALKNLIVILNPNLEA